MSRVILYIAKSVDGFISGPNDEMDWIPIVNWKILGERR